MKIGDRVTRIPETFMEPEHAGPGPRSALTGTVVYIHPKGRYHTVEFIIRGRRVRESFQGVEE